MNKVTLKINDQEIVCNEGRTIMEAALENNIYVPALCEHPDFPHKANCRVCVVEIEGRKNLSTSCSTMAEEGMVIRTDSDRVKKSRNLNIEMLFAEHIEKCATCIWRVNCKLLDLAERYKILITTFKDRKGSRKTYKLCHSIEIDGTQCIDCRNCIDACSTMQKINHLEVRGKGVNQEIVPTDDKKNICIDCGQCALHCPVGSAQEQSSWEDVEKVLKDGSKTVVLQISLAALSSVGEEFKEEASEELYDKIVGAAKKLGFKYIFNDNLPNLITASKLAEQISEKAIDETVITSSCPAWVKYVEQYHPELKDRLSKVKSPHIVAGGIIKTHWAKKMNLDHSDVTVVSVLPCTAAKCEIQRDDIKKDLQPVDHVLTVREFAWMIKKNRLELQKMERVEMDLMFESTVKAPMFCASGGETEAVFSVATYLSNGKKNDKLMQDEKLLFSLRGFKEVDIEYAGIRMKTAIVNGIGNIDKILKDPGKYDFIEVRACPGGCVGGGGQAIPTTAKSRKTRLDVLKKMKGGDILKPDLEILDWIKENNLEDKILY